MYFFRLYSWKAIKGRSREMAAGSVRACETGILWRLPQAEANKCFYLSPLVS
jgi:hypothetical protein